MTSTTDRVKTRLSTVESVDLWTERGYVANRIARLKTIYKLRDIHMSEVTEPDGRISFYAYGSSFSIGRLTTIW
jgi:hypothetical protein